MMVNYLYRKYGVLIHNFTRNGPEVQGTLNQNVLQKKLHTL